MIRKTGPPDSSTQVSMSDPGPRVPVSGPSSGDVPRSITEDAQETVAVSGPGPSTSGMSRPGPSRHVIHINNTDTYISGENFDYFAGSADLSDDSDMDNDNDDNDTSVPVAKVDNDDSEDDDNDGPEFFEDDDDMEISDDNEDDNDKNDKNDKAKRPRRNKWDERQELKWEHFTKKCLYEAAKEDMANGVYSSIRKCANYYGLHDKTLGKLIRENREYVGDGKKSQG